MAAARKKKQQPASAPARIAPAIDGPYVRRLLASVDRAVAQQDDPFDTRDKPRDRLFALLMQRIDCLQAARTEYMRVLDAVPRQPGLLLALAPGLHAAMSDALRRAELPATPAHATALGLAYAATVAAWRNDTSADLSKTMKACDRALSLLERLAEFVPNNSR